MALPGYPGKTLHSIRRYLTCDEPVTTRIARSPSLQWLVFDKSIVKYPRDEDEDGEEEELRKQPRDNEFLARV
jgi:hypothetical protein